MVIHRTKFFLALALIIMTPFLASKIIWLTHSQKTEGILAFEGMGESGEQIRLDYSVIHFKHGKDTIWFNGLGNLHLQAGMPVPVRYQTGNPSDAKVDIFVSIWGDTLVYGGIPLFILLILFLHPKVVPRRSKLRLSHKKPFIRIV